MKKLLVIAFAVMVGLTPFNNAQADTMVGPFSFTKTSFEFYYTLGGGQPTHQSLEFTNTTNSVIYVNLSVPNQPAWLNAGYSTDSLATSPGSPMGLGAAVSVDGLNPGSYSTSIYISGQFSNSPIRVPISLTIYPQGQSQPSNAVHPEGTNVSTSDGTVWRINQGSRQPYTSAGAFLSYGYNSWADVKVANAADLALPSGSCTPAAGGASRPCFISPRDGSLINDNGTVYIISDGYRYGFANVQAFLGLGYSFSHALAGDTSFLSTGAPINSAQISHPSGTVVNDNGTICVINSPFRSGNGQVTRGCFSTLSDMNSWGIRNYEILPANNEDKLITIGRIIEARTAYSSMNP